MSNFLAIHHTSFIVSDLSKALKFYCDILGLTIDETRPEHAFEGAWLVINPQQQIHLLSVDNPDSKNRPPHGGRDRHTAFIVNDFQLIKQQLENANISYTESMSGRSALFCRDPDGNTLEIMT
jgi:glyoxylase I family protein